MARVPSKVYRLGVAGSVLSVEIDASAALRAAASLGGMTGRGNSIGERQLINPRDVVAKHIPPLTRFAHERIRALTPNKRISETFVVRAEVSDTGTAENQAAGLIRAASAGGSIDPRAMDVSGDFIRNRIESNLPPSEQIIVTVMENGSRAHIIRAKRGSQRRDGRGRFQRTPEAWMRIPISGGNVLPGARIVRESDGALVVFVKRVNHPGTPPHAMFRRTLIEIVPMSDRAAREIVSEVVADWERRAML